MSRGIVAGRRRASLLPLAVALLAAAAPAAPSAQLLDAGAADDAWIPSSAWAEPAPAPPWAPGPEEAAEQPEPAPALSATLPAVEPDPDVAPVVEDAPVERPVAVEPRQRPGLAIRTVLALAALVLLAYAANHPTVERYERRLGIAQVVTAGLPFLFLGMAARHPAVGILTDELLAQLAPVLRISLGWIGFVVGFRLDARALTGVDERAVASAALLSSIPFVAVFVAASAVLAGGAGAFPRSLADPVLLRDALVLGTAASITAGTAPGLLPRAARRALARTATIVRLEELAGIAGLALVAAWFRPADDATWRIPGAAWLMITVGAGTMLGLLVFALVRRAEKPAEFALLAIGSVAFASGLAGYLHLSSVVVCFVAALLLVNFPGAHQERFRAALADLERPIYLLLLVTLGALWPIRSGVGWALIPVFAGVRLGARAVATRLGRAARVLDLDRFETRVLTVAPVGSLAIAIVVSSQLLYPSGSMRDAVVAVVGGALVTEGLVQAVRRRGAARLGGAR
jgi:hypothetical protein